MDETTETLYEEAGLKELSAKKYKDAEKLLKDADFTCSEVK